MHRLKVFATLAALAMLTVPAARAEQPHPFAGHRQVTVMTQNLYLGTDLNPIFAAANQFALFAAVGNGWAQVQSNDFTARAQAIADEIAAAKPDLVGLQEAMLYRTDFPPDGPATPAGTVAYDYLDLLLDALADRGLPYERVAVFEGNDVELPAGLPPTLDVRFTYRIALIARADEKTADLKLSNPQSGAFPTALTLVNPVFGQITAPRGWTSVDVKIRGKSFRFVNTHLEAFSTALRNAQAAEVLTGPAATDLPTVLVGDINSGPGVDLTAYGILQAGGFSDAAAGAGVTCCHKNDLHDANAPLTKRLDLILARGGFDTVSADVVGDQLADRTPSGLWPSDHAGLVATLELP